MGSGVLGGRVADSSPTEPSGIDSSPNKSSHIDSSVNTLSECFKASLASTWTIEIVVSVSVSRSLCFPLSLLTTSFAEVFDCSVAFDFGPDRDPLMSFPNELSRAIGLFGTPNSVERSDAYDEAAETAVEVLDDWGAEEEAGILADPFFFPADLDLQRGFFGACVASGSSSSVTEIRSFFEFIKAFSGTGSQWGVAEHVWDSETHLSHLGCL